MILEYNIDQENRVYISDRFKSDWAIRENKVFVFRGNIGPAQVRDFYETFFSQIGEFLNYAEDGREKDRNKGRTGEVWMEIRNDSSIENAYRHSTAAQPLHTDGSYIPGFPTSVLICESNVAKGGETIFVSISDILQSLESYDKDLYKFVTTEPITHARSGEKRTERIFYVENGVEKVNFRFFCSASI